MRHESLQVVSQMQMPLDASHVCVGPQLPQHAGSTLHKPVTGSHDLQAPGEHPPALLFSHASHWQPFMALHADAVEPLHAGLQFTPVQEFTWQKPHSGPDVAHELPAGHVVLPQVVSHKQVPQVVVSFVLLSHTVPCPQPPTLLQVVSHTHAPVLGLHTVPAGQLPHCGGKHAPHVGEEGLLLQVCPPGQPPMLAHVVSQ
jgi:hypothetical protein